MNQRDNYNPEGNQHANWHPKADLKPNTGKGKIARIKAGIRGAVTRTGEVVANTARATQEGVIGGMKTAGRGIKKAGESTADVAHRVVKATGQGIEAGANKAREAAETIAYFTQERYNQLTNLIGETLTSEAGRKTLQGIPVARGILTIIESARGETTTHQPIGIFKRTTGLFRGAKEISADTTKIVVAGKLILAKKIMEALIEMGPEGMILIGEALEKKQLHGGNTLVTLGKYLREHPALYNKLKKSNK